MVDKPHRDLARADLRGHMDDLQGHTGREIRYSISNSVGAVLLLTSPPLRLLSLRHRLRELVARFAKDAC